VKLIRQCHKFRNSLLLYCQYGMNELRNLFVRVRNVWKGL